MLPIPEDRNLDSTLALLLEGYQFISKRCQRYKSDIFQTRLLLEKTICFKGEEAAKAFYDSEKFIRKNAAPQRLKKTLFGQDGVQGMDGVPHWHRKQMFMSLMSDDSIQELVSLAREQWHIYSQNWKSKDKIVLFEEVQRILCRAGCAWAGVPLPESEVEQRTKELEATIHSSGAIGLEHWQGRKSRQKAEKWIEGIIEQIRTRQLKIAEDSAAYIIASHRDLEGKLLDKHTAAVELINIIRPIVAIARYVTFAALALHEHPEASQKLRTIQRGDDYYEWFVQEVRRFYPFFPFAAAIVRQDFDWHEYHFPQGTRVLLDLYGTDRDSKIWKNPEVFDPERFREWNGSQFNFIPQGGGDYYSNHRCPGERITIELMKQAVDFLTKSVQYELPKQNLDISLSKMPTVPKSGFVISNVEPM